MDLLFQFYISTIIIEVGHHLVRFSGISILHKYDYHCAVSLDCPSVSPFQFYISTIIMPPRKHSRDQEQISILHKYDYHWRLCFCAPTSVRISILHKYDYHLLLVYLAQLRYEISILHKYDYHHEYEQHHWAVRQFQFYISTIIIVPLLRPLVHLAVFQFYISTIIMQRLTYTSWFRPHISILHKYDYHTLECYMGRDRLYFNST